MIFFSFLLLALLGLVIGSFLNVAIYRLPVILQKKWRIQSLEFLHLPREEIKAFNLFWPPSHCIHCKKHISLWQNIPLLSFILQKGKCAHCKKQISWRYPVVEIITCGFTLLCFYHWGWKWQFPLSLIFCWSLIVLFFIDVEHQILPDELTLSLLWLGLLCSINTLFVNSTDAILGAFLGYTSLWLIGWLFKIIRKIEGIGYGDYKLFAALGAWLGWQILPFVLLCASFLGLVVGFFLLYRKKIHHKTPVAFGPYLIIAGVIAFYSHSHPLDIMRFLQK